MFKSELKDNGYIVSALSWFPDGKKSGEIKNGNGKVLTPKSVPDNYDTLVVKDRKVQNAAYKFFRDR